MPIISTSDLALLRQQHKAKFYLTPCPASVLWSAQVAGAHSREDTTIAFDGGGGANFAAITAGMELWIGTSAGDYDVDRLRIKSVSSGDSGVTGTFTVADNSVVWADNQHLTVIGWFLLKPRRPDIGDDGTFYKDGGSATGGITYTDQNSEPTPVTIAGENRAGFVEGGSWVIASQLPSSYAIASGATISSYAASLVYGPDTPVISINSGTGVGTITFDTAGLYWIKWTCTDSNGKSQDTYRWYYAHSTDPQNAHYPITQFSINNVQGQWNNGGWSCGVQIHGNADLDAIPDYAPCIVWSENWYGTTKKNITFLPDESGTVIGGYIRRDKFSQDIEKDAHVADFSITTIQGVGDNKYNFSVSLEANQTVDTWWKYPSWLTPTRAVHHFFKWHSTLLEVADVIGLDDNTDGDSHVEFPDGSLFERANGALAVIRSRLVCNAGSRVVFVEDVQLRPDSERSGLTVVQDITSADKNGQVDFVREQEKRVPFMYLAAFDYDGGFKADGNPEVFSRCAIAPGNNAYEDGAQPATEGRQIVVDQTHANQVVGRFLAAANNEYPEVTVPMVGRLGVLAIHLSEFWTLTMATGDTARGIAKTLNLILRQVTAAINVQQGTIACTATFEAEASGPVGIATECPGFPDLPDTDFEIPDADSELGGALMTASSINYLPPQSKSWVERSAENVLDAYADPHWPIKQDSFASADAIIWRSGVGYIKRSVDAGVNWSTVTPGDPPNDASDSPAPIVANVSFIRGEGNFVVDQEHVFIARWQNASNDWRSWIAHTADDGANWTWQSIGGGTPVGASGNSLESGTVTLTAGAVYSSQMMQSNTRMLVSGDSDGGVFVALFGVDAGAKTVSEIDSVIGGDAKAGRLVRGDDEHALLIYTASNNLQCRVIDINGDTISIGAEHTIDGALNSSVIEFDGARQSDNTIMVCYGTWGVAGDNTYLQKVNISESTDVASNSGSKATIAGVSRRGLTMWPIGGDEGTPVSLRDVFITYRDPGDNKLYGFMAENTAGGVTALSAQLLDNTAIRITPTTPATAVYTHWQTMVAVGSDKDVMVKLYASSSGPSDRAVVVDCSDINSLDIGTAAALTGSYTWFAKVGYRSINRIVATAAAGGEYDWQTGTVDLAGLTFDLDDNAITTASFVGWVPYYIGDSLYALTIAGDGAGIWLVEETLGTGGVVRALGMSIGKGVGELLYITAHDGSSLVLMLYSLPGLVLVDNISLGAATESEVNANTWIARPYSPFGSDQACYIYGRMDDPLGSGTAHIILTEDEALSFSEVEQGWSADFCGALLEDYGRVMAIRNLSASSKLYTGAVGSALKVASTLPFTAQVNPQAMIFDFINGALYCGSASADSIMVVVSPEPNFHRWFDLSYDHDNTTGIRSVITL